MSNLANRLMQTAQTSGERPALRLDDQIVTYAEFADHAARIAAWFVNQGVSPGDRVGLIFPNVPAFPLHYYGALTAGAIIVPMNPLLKAGEIEYYLTDSGAKHVIAMDEFAAEARKACDKVGMALTEVGPTESAAGDHEPVDAVAERDRDRDRDDTAVILYTSGTTGKTKGAELTHWNLEHNAQTTVDVLVQTSDTDVIMGCLPLFHVFGLTCGLNTAVLCGAALNLLPRFDPAQALQMIQRNKVTVFVGVPTMYAGMLHDDSRDEVDLSSLRTCLSGGSPMPVEVMRNFEEQFGCEILEGYGLSESLPVASFNQPHLERKPGTVGPTVPDVEMKVVDLDGKEVPQGEAAVIGIPHPTHGEEVGAAVALKDGREGCPDRRPDGNPHLRGCQRRELVGLGLHVVGHRVKIVGALLRREVAVRGAHRSGPAANGRVG